MEILSAFILGFLGSFHCVGMCGPIALAIPRRKPGVINSLIDNFLYNGGRIITYSILGLLLGFMGRGLRIAGLQENLSLYIGGLILAYILIPSKIKRKAEAMPIIPSALNNLKRKLGLLLKPKSAFGLMSLGLLNGLLPCGLVYVGLAGSVAVGSALDGALFMAFFGLGTIPAMTAIFMSGELITIDIRKKINKLIPYAVASIAILMMLRGMSLGIPYVSPKLNNNIVSVDDQECNEFRVKD